MGSFLSKDTTTKKHISKKYLKRFDVDEIEVLKKVYKELSARSPGLGIDKETFLQYFPLPGLWGERLFQHFDFNGNGLVEYEEFLIGIAVCCRGTQSDRVQVLFHAFDLNNDGFIQKSELVTMLSNLPDLSKFVAVTNEDLPSTSYSSLQNQEKALQPYNTMAASSSSSFEYRRKVRGSRGGKAKRVAIAHHRVTRNASSLRTDATGPIANKALVAPHTHTTALQVHPFDTLRGEAPSLTGSDVRLSSKMDLQRKSRIEKQVDPEEDAGEKHSSDEEEGEEEEKEEEEEDEKEEEEEDEKEEEEDEKEEEEEEEKEEEEEDEKEEEEEDEKDMASGGAMLQASNSAANYEFFCDTSAFKNGGSSERSKKQNFIFSKILTRRRKEIQRQMGAKKNPSVLAQSLIDKEQEEETNHVQEDVEALVDKIIEECEFVECGQLSSLQFRAWLEKNEGILKMFTDCLHEEVWGIEGNALYRSAALHDRNEAQLSVSSQPLCYKVLKNKLFNPLFSIASLGADQRKISSCVTQDKFLKIKKLFNAPQIGSIESAPHPTPFYGKQQASPVEGKSHDPSPYHLMNFLTNAESELFPVGLYNCFYPSNKNANLTSFSTSRTEVNLNIAQEGKREDFLSCPNCKTRFIRCTACHSMSPSLELRDGKVVLECDECVNGRETACWNCKWEFQKCTELLSKFEPVKAGVLYKIGRHMHKWIPRYFVLIDNALYYYKRKDDPKPRGFMFLEGCYVEHYDVDYHLNKYGFSINHISEKVPRRCLFASNPEDCQEWIVALRGPMKQQNLNHLYRICEQIGHGKFSVVYRGVHRETGFEYAIKVIDKGKVSSYDKELLRSEMAILRLLRFPNVIYFKEVLDTKEQLYIAMELVKGGELYDLIHSRRRLPELHVNRIVKQLLCTVAYLHKCGIIHRDIKPENILLIDKSPEATIKLTDFGLSTLCGPNELLFEPCGTLAYVAPEVLMLEGYNHKVDVWSIGVVLYLLLGGKLPFTTVASLEKENIYKHYTVKFEGDVWKEISTSAKDLVWRMLQPNPQKRICVSEALQHMWITNPTAVINEASPDRHFDDESSEDYGITDARYATFAADMTGSSFLVSSVLQKVAGG